MSVLDVQNDKLSTAETDNENSPQKVIPKDSEEFLIQLNGKTVSDLKPEGAYFQDIYSMGSVAYPFDFPNLLLLKINKLLSLFRDKFKGAETLKKVLSNSTYDFNSFGFIVILIKYVDFLYLAKQLADTIAFLTKDNQLTNEELVYLKVKLMNTLLFDIYDLSQHFFRHFSKTIVETKYKFLFQANLYPQHAFLFKFQGVVLQKVITEFDEAQMHIFEQKNKYFWTVLNINMIPYFVGIKLVEVIMVIFEVEHLECIICNSRALNSMVDVLNYNTAEYDNELIDDNRKEVKYYAAELVKYFFNSKGDYDLKLLDSLFDGFANRMIAFANSLYIKTVSSNINFYKTVK